MARGPGKIKTPFLREQLKERIGHGRGKLPLTRMENFRLFGRPSRPQSGLVNKRRLGRETTAREWKKMVVERGSQPLPWREKPRLRERITKRLDLFWRRGKLKSRPRKGWMPQGRG